MAYDFVTENDLAPMAQALTTRGLHGEDLTTKLKEAANELEYTRWREQAPRGFIPTAVRAAVSGAPTTFGLALTGVSKRAPYLPEYKTETPRAVGEALQRVEMPLWRRQAAEAGAGRLFDPGMGERLGSWLGGQLPVLGVGVASTALGQLAGNSIGGFVVSTDTFMGMEHEGFVQTFKDMPFDDDLVERYAADYGSVAGLIENFQMMGMLAPWKKGVVQAGKIASTSILIPMLKTLGKELVANTLEGMEEVGQGMFFNTQLDAMVAEQNSRNQEKGLPPVDYEQVATLKEDYDELFERGFSVAAMVRGPSVMRRGVSKAARVAERGIEKVTARAIGETLTRQPTKELLDEAAKVVTEVQAIEPSIAAKGTAQARKEALQRLTPKQKRTLLDDLAPAGWGVLARNYKIPINYENGTPKTNEQIREELQQAIGGVDEGPVVVKRPQRDVEGHIISPTSVEVIKPVLNPATKVDVRRGTVVNNFLVRAVGAIRTDLEAWLPEFDATRDIPSDMERRRNVVNALQWRSLQTVVGERIADELLPRSATYLSENRPPKLQEVLRRDQFTQYSDNLEGEVRNLMRNVEGKNAENALLQDLSYNFQARLDEATLISPVRLRDGGVLDITQVPEEQEGVKLPFFRRWAALLPSLESIEKRTGLPMMALDSSLFEAHKKRIKIGVLLQAAERNVWRKLPKSLRAGTAGERMRELVHYVKTDNTQRRNLERTLKRPRGYKYFVDAVADAGTLKDKDEILKLAKQAADEFDPIYQWFVNNGMIRPDHFHQFYAPAIRMFVNDKKKGGMTLTEWIGERRDEKNAKGKFTKRARDLRGMSKKGVEQLGDIADTLRSWERRRYVAPGQAPGFMEYQRAADNAFMRDLGIVPDLREANDVYIRKAAQVLAFRHLAPATAVVVSQANKVLTGKNREVFNAVLGNYLETLTGIPDAGTKALMKIKFPSASTQLVKGTNKLIDFVNKVAPTDFRKLEVKNPDKTFSGADAMDLGMTYLYALTLGLPTNITSPVKNLTQGPLTVGLFGTRRYLAGMMHLMKEGVLPSILKRSKTGLALDIHEKNLRPEMKGWEMLELGTARGKWATAAKGMLSLYRLSDLVNVYSAAATADYSWSLIDPSMSDRQIIETLFKGERPEGVNDIEVMKPKNSIGDFWKGVVSKPVALTVVEMIREGKMEDAKQLLMQYAVNMSQWRYGAGGRPGYQRNAFWRAALMYTSWPTNYADYWGRLMASKNYSRMTQVAMSQVAIAMVFNALGYKAWKWILFGPLPEKILPLGPLVTSIIEPIWQILRGSAIWATAEITGAPQEEADRERKMVERRFKDLLE